MLALQNQSFTVEWFWEDGEDWGKVFFTRTMKESTNLCEIDKLFQNAMSAKSLVFFNKKKHFLKKKQINFTD